MTGGSNTYKEPMSKQVQSELEKLISASKLLSKDSREIYFDVVPLGSVVLSFCLVLIWILINWVIGLFTDIDFGWNSQYSDTILITIALSSFIYFSYAVLKTQLMPKELRQKIQLDIKNKTVNVSEYAIKEIKKFEEPEHGGLAYFLLTTDNDVLFLFDSESQDLAISGKNPESSSMQPSQTLKIYKSPIANYYINEEFTGEAIVAPELKILTSKANTWPEHGEMVKIQWSQIDKMYAEKSA